MSRYMTLLCAGVLLTGGPAFAKDHQTAHEKAVAAIHKLGGEVVVDSKQSGAPVSVTLTGSGNVGECLPRLKDLKNIQTCDL